MAKYKRVLLKLSGEALMGNQQYGIDNDRLLQYCEEVKAVSEKGVEVAIVIGGGNIYRGMQADNNQLFVLSDTMDRDEEQWRTPL